MVVYYSNGFRELLGLFVINLNLYIDFTWHANLVLNNTMRSS
jgi:hypothetical protein